MGTDPQAEIIRAFHADRRLAHRILFKSRHKHADPAFHEELIEDLHSGIQNLSDIAFRGSAKSTRAEEAVILKAGLREFKYGLFIGSTMDLAAERLHAVRVEIERNELLLQVFGDLKGPTWADDKLILSNGITIKAMGRGQSIRGTKDDDTRPDFVVLDDIEDDDSVRTPELRRRTASWLFSELLPALDPGAKVRMLSNVLDAECLSMSLKEAGPSGGWVTRTYPIEYIESDGTRAAMWPDRFPLEAVDKLRGSWERNGKLREFQMNYMCEATSEHDRAFTAEMIRVVPHVRLWQPVQGFFDPARTTNRQSANTGFAAWSWVGRKLVVWDAWGEMLMPADVIDRVFQFDEDYRPVEIGIERDGLEEWLMQPIRAEQARRGSVAPIRPMKAPVGKLDFIRSLQIYFNAREIEFAKELPDLKRELLAFPGGRKDIANALAYALKMRPGLPVYEDFTGANVSEDLQEVRNQPLSLVLNATASMVTAALVQTIDGGLRVLADWVREGEALAVIAPMVREASVFAARRFRFFCPPRHFQRYENVGLVQAVQRLPAEIRQGVEPETGRPEIAAMMQRQVRGFPALMVSSAARWTLNALSGGYCRGVDKSGRPHDHAEEGYYRVLMESLESYAGLMVLALDDGTRSDLNYRTGADGRPYVSALRGR